MINQNKHLALGIDIGGTNTVMGLADNSGNVLWKISVNTKQYKNPEAFIQALHHAFIQNTTTDFNNIDGIGIGAPNGNYYTGEIKNAANLPWKGTIPIREMIAATFGLPATVTNDANAAAMGEKIFGAAKGMNDFIFITLGTGLGSGIIANGKMVYGHDGFAGEFGHTIAVRDGRSCGCGRKGCLETYVSATGIVRTAIEQLNLNRNTKSILRRKHQDINEITSSEISNAAAKGDTIALKVFDETAHILGLSLADLVALFSPEAIIFFGGLAQSGALLLQPAQRYMEAALLSIYKGKTKFLRSSIPDNDAAILGAASLVWEKEN